MLRLQNVYGGVKYPSERLDLFYMEFKDLEACTFRMIVSELIKREAYAPLMNKFKEAMAPFKERIAEEKNARFKEQTEGKHCPHCNDLGVIMARSKDKNQFGLYDQAAFKCQCPRGEQEFSGFPHFGPRARSLYVRQ